MEAEMLFWGRTEKKKMTKSNFKETCCRFSQFLKEKRSLGQLDAFKDIASSELDIIGIYSFSISIHFLVMFVSDLFG